MVIQILGDGEITFLGEGKTHIGMDREPQIPILQLPVNNSDIQMPLVGDDTVTLFAEVD